MSHGISSEPLTRERKSRSGTGIWLGITLILLSGLANHRILGGIFAEDGEFHSWAFIGAIVCFQVICLCAGGLLLSRRWLPSKPGPWFSRACLFWASFMVSLIAAELWLRATQPSVPYDSLEFRVPDPVLGWRLKPGAVWVRELSAGDVTVRYNRDGWRDVDHELTKPEGVFRILVLGDSYIEGYTVSLERQFSRQLERLANATGRQVEVLSMGVGGYGTLQEMLVFEQFGVKYDPDLVLLAFYPMNDLENNRFEDRNASRPMLEPGGKDDWQVRRPDYEESLTQYNAALARRRETKSGLIHQTALAKAVSRSWRRLGRRYVVEGRNIDVSRCVETEDVKLGWAATERILWRLRESVEAHGAKLAVFSVPSILEVDEGVRARLLADLAHPEEFCLEDAPAYSRMRELLNRAGVPWVDLLPVFRRATRDEGKSLYPVDDGHWNAAGHELAARTVWSAIEGSLVP